MFSRCYLRPYTALFARTVPSRVGGSRVEAILRSVGLQQAREWGIQVVSLDWVWACQTANKLVSCAPFRLKPFTGLVICCTGLDTGAQILTSEKEKSAKIERN